MGGSQNYGPLLNPLNTRCRIIIYMYIYRTQKGTIVLITTHIYVVYLYIQFWEKDPTRLDLGCMLTSIRQETQPCFEAHRTPFRTKPSKHERRELDPDGGIEASQVEPALEIAGNM